jgi:16S rRNA (cytidine1402-2'-O)-methyltransferase
MSHRAVETLQQVAVVLAEDTRHSRPLLDHFGVKTKVQAYHEHNEAKSTPVIVARLQAGESFALISDAGTPVLSDPGSRLVEAAVAAGVTVTAVPGASALLAALVASGISGDRFTYFGFLPRRGSDRRNVIGEIAGLRHTAVVYEAPSRVGATLREIETAGAGGRRAVVARELTKKFEEHRRGTVAELAMSYSEEAPRGEVVLVIEGGTAEAAPAEDAIRARAAELRGEGMSAREIVRVLMIEMNAPRNTAYRVAHE